MYVFFQDDTDFLGLFHWSNQVNKQHVVIYNTITETRYLLETMMEVQMKDHPANRIKHIYKHIAYCVIDKDKYL